MHDWNEIPRNSLGIGVPPGFQGYLSGKKQVRSMVNQPPWSSCILTDETTGEPYSIRNCIEQCETKQTVHDCGCRLWYQSGNQKQCGVAQSVACSFFLLYCKS